MDLFDSFREECINVNSEAANKETVLRDIAKAAKNSPALEAFSEEQLFEALNDREKVGSTGFENGIAIPHCRMKNMDEFVVGLVMVPSGVDFGALDKKPSDIFFFIIGPADKRNEHIRILSGISRAMAIKGVTRELKNAHTPEEARELFLRHVVDRLNQSENDEKNFFSIYVQEESKFTDILQAVAALTPSVSVVEGNDPAKYLNALPLFATFWNSEDKGFHRIITGLINKKLANELIRGVNVITDGLENKSGVQIVVMNTAYSSGSLRE